MAWLSVLSADVPPNIRMIVGKGGETAYLPRVKAVHDLGGRLPPEVRGELFEFLRRPHPGREIDDTRLIEYNAIKNEIVVAMLKWDGNVPELARELVAMYGNEKMDGMWRNYCVQFLGQIFGKIADPDSRAATLGVFENALASPSGGMAGTALIAMRANMSEPEIGERKVVDAAFRLTQADRLDDAGLATGIQIGAALGDERLLPLCRKLAGDASTRIRSRMAALAALGLLGGKEDLPLLNDCRNNPDVRLRTAARGAAERLRRKR